MNSSEILRVERKKQNKEDLKAYIKRTLAAEE